MGKKHDTNTETAALSEETAQLRTQVADLTETLQRLQAEFENYRKRTEIEKAALREGAADRLLTDLLPIADHLELAIEHTKEHADTKDLLAGILLVRDQLHQLLAEHGVTPLPTEGPFDPKRHEAIITENSAQHPSKHITKTFQRGYARGERTLRPARVSVAK